MGVGNVGIGIVGEVEGIVAATVGMIFACIVHIRISFSACNILLSDSRRKYMDDKSCIHHRRCIEFTTVVASSSFNHDFFTCTTLCKKLTKSSASSVATVVVLLDVGKEVVVQLASIIGAGVA